MSDGRDKEAPMRIVLFVVASLAAVVACRSSSTPTPDTGGGGGGGGGAVTIEMIQNGTVPTGTQVEIDNVIVTAIDNFGGTTGNLWVEDPAGGAYSGVLVYKADANVVATLAVGDQVTITNALTDQFALTGSNADPTGRTDTELEPLASGQTVTVTRNGSGMVPAPVVVDALSIGQMSDADTQGPNFSMAWRQYLGVLITVNNVSALSAPKKFGSTTPTPADDYSFGITGVAKIEGSLSDITASGIARNTCFSSVTGVVDYFYDFLLLPRQTSDMATGGTGCPAAETVCNNSIDDDGNGFADCPTATTSGDDNCIITDTTCQDATATIATLDAAADVAPTAPQLPYKGVSITGACVTAVNGTNVFVSNKAGVASADGGIYVYGGGVALPSGVMMDSKVDIIGTATGFKATASTSADVQLELNSLQMTLDTGSCVVTPATGMTAATLSVDSTGHKWIGQPIQLDTAHGGAISITTATTATNHFGTMTQGSTTFAFDDAIVHDTAASGTSYATVVGIWTYDTQANSGAGGYEIVLTTAPL
jgi:hypothetical protein